MNKPGSQPERRPRRRSRAEVADVVAAFEQSGLSRSEYCRQHGLSLSTLKRYCKPVPTQCTAPAVSLIPVEVVDRAAAHEAEHTALCVELAGRRRIGVGVGFDVVTLRRLIAVLDAE
jgi:lambda repressor-like predicted transcriptional regulator